MSEIDVEPVDRVDDDDVGEESHGEGDEAPEEVGDESAGDDSVEVETTPDLPAGVDAPEYVLYGGKGGVGKTTMAAATALSSAAGNVSTLVVSTDPAHSLSDTFGLEIPADPTRIREDIPLYAAEIDPDAAMEAGMFGSDGPVGDRTPGTDDGDTTSPGDQTGMGDADAPMENPLSGLLEGGGMESFFGGTMPGADEAAAMQQLIEHLDDPRFDRVVIDTAPTGHTLRLLQLPEILDTMVGRMMKLRERLSGVMDGLKGMLSGEDQSADSADLEELRERIERLRRVLRDPNRTDFRIVLVPEAMSIVESERLLARLGEFGIPVGTIVVNRVMEDPESVAGTHASLDAEWLVSPNHDDCAFCRRRWEVQQEALRQASDLFRGRDVKRVPLLAGEVQGEAALKVVAACLDQ